MNDQDQVPRECSRYLYTHWDQNTKQIGVSSKFVFNMLSKQIILRFLKTHFIINVSIHYYYYFYCIVISQVGYNNMR